MIIVQLDSEQLHSLIQNAVRKVLSEPKKAEGSAQTDCWFNLTELCAYLPDKPSKATVYGWVSAGTIPFHKGGKKLRFLQSEIDNWLKRDGNNTREEIAAQALTYLKKKRG